MSPTKFSFIPQPVFPNQRDDERIFVFSRRHVVDYLYFIIILSILVVVPIIAIPLILSSLQPTAFLSDVYARDIVVMLSAAYYLILDIVFLTSWINYYYNAIVVTDERIVEIVQLGLFSREVNELSYEQIEDVSCKVRGPLYTLLGVGNVELQSAGPESNFVIKGVPQPYVTVEIIHELSAQAKRGVPMKERFPELGTVGIINGRLIDKGLEPPPIMNIDGRLKETTQRYCSTVMRPRNLRERFDRWWFDHCNQMQATFGQGKVFEDDIQKLKNMPEKNEGEKSEKMEDL
jgi:hypothetical protein